MASENWLVYASAIVGVIALMGAGAYGAAHVFGRNIADIEQDLADWLLKDSAGWRAREVRKVEVAKQTARLGGAA